MNPSREVFPLTSRNSLHVHGPVPAYALKISELTISEAPFFANSILIAAKSEERSISDQLIECNADDFHRRIASREACPRS